MPILARADVIFKQIGSQNAILSIRIIGDDTRALTRRIPNHEANSCRDEIRREIEAMRSNLRYFAEHGGRAHAPRVHLGLAATSRPLAAEMRAERNATPW